MPGWRGRDGPALSAGSWGSSLWMGAPRLIKPTKGMEPSVPARCPPARTCPPLPREPRGPALPSAAQRCFMAARAERTGLHARSAVGTTSPSKAHDGAGGCRTTLGQQHYPTQHPGAVLPPPRALIPPGSPPWFHPVPPLAAVVLSSPPPRQPCFYILSRTPPCSHNSFTLRSAAQGHHILTPPQIQPHLLHQHLPPPRKPYCFPAAPSHTGPQAWSRQTAPAPRSPGGRVLPRPVGPRLLEAFPRHLGSHWPQHLPLHCRLLPPAPLPNNPPGTWFLPSSGPPHRPEWPRPPATPPSSSHGGLILLPPRGLPNEQDNALSSPSATG